MNEQSFIREMQSALGGLSDDQREDILSEYRSHFFEGKERGKSEEEISSSLGDPRAVARTYLADYHFTAWRSPAPGQSVGTSVSHLLRGMIITLSLLFFNFFLMLVPVLMYSACVAALWVVTGALMLVGFAFLVVALIGGSSNVLLPDAATQAALGFYSVSAMACGGLGAIGVFHLTRVSLKALIKWIRLNINLATAS